MPFIRNELRWESTALLPRETRFPRRARSTRSIHTSVQQLPPLWEEADRDYNMYMSDEQFRQRVDTPTDALNEPLVVEIESHRSSIASVPSTQTTQGTNFNLTDSIDIEVDQKYLNDHNLDSDKSDNLKEVIAIMSSESDPEDDNISLPVNSLRMLSVPTMLPPATAAAKRLASMIIRHARFNKIPNEQEMCCSDCGLIPILPVTGQCGHTRCTKCIKDKGACSCGAPEPASLHVNTLVQDIITKMVVHCPVSRRKVHPVRWEWLQRLTASESVPPVTLQRASRCNSKLYRRFARSSAEQPGEVSRDAADATHTAPMSMQVRYEMGRKLITLGRYSDAAPYLAHVGASTEPTASKARILLAQIITVMSGNRESRRLTRELYRGVRDHAATAWLKATDLECILCCNTFTEPVTTPCGHTYCRTCIERLLDYRKKCALCLRSLDNFNLAMTGVTTFISAALTSIDALRSQQPLDTDVIPIFVCTVAYPSIPCPLFIFDPRYWLMVRRVLASDSRQFGMVAYERDRTYSNYGTILKVCDCVYLEDGRSILSTVGMSRFRVIEREVRDGCDVARVEPLADIVPNDRLMIWELQVTGAQICYKALIWLHTMSKSIYSEIQSTFGEIPKMDCLNSKWWETADGPTWMWWLIAILPLKSEIKILILSTQNLLKRMTAVYRTLEAIDRISMTSATNEELTEALNTAQEWLLRGS
ncbi:uncharacterized protein LOC115448551 isoform X2 [Manduca sexta]|nr:uncharacterized protein LOC115448551 isoform X2 [Manduca sexta]XP_037299731.1 uncharacterized protein LOC115448551 isoform X2 [Manduca sexta]XP_037299732.1 uncharacterized protein LOC115448551 isoform X2 [Manduca sexta]